MKTLQLVNQVEKSYNILDELLEGKNEWRIQSLLYTANTPYRMVSHSYIAQHYGENAGELFLEIRKELHHLEEFGYSLSSDTLSHIKVAHDKISELILVFYGVMGETPFYLLNRQQVRTIGDEYLGINSTW